MKNKCQYCGRPFATWVRQLEHEQDCAKEVQEILDNQWEEKLEERAKLRERLNA